MSTRDALTERAKKATEVSREQVRVYLGANDHWYEQLRTRPSALTTIQEFPAKLRTLRVSGADLASAVEPYKPSEFSRAVHERIEAALQRRKGFAERGERIVQDWHLAAPVQDVDALLKAVRTADGAREIAKAVRDWANGTTISAAPQPKAAPRAATAKVTKPAAKSGARKSAAPASAPKTTASAD